MRRLGKKHLLLGFAAILVIGAAFSYRRSPSSATLRDGTVLRLTGAKIGWTNEFKHGTWPDKLLGRWIGTKGWKIGKWKVIQPSTESYSASTNTTTLTVQLKLTGESNQVAESYILDRPPALLRVVHWGEDGFRYIGEWQDGFYGSRRDGYYGYFDTAAFSRRSRNLHFELYERDTVFAEWELAAALHLQNPEPAKAQAWPASPYPVTNRFGEFAAVLGTIEVRQSREPGGGPGGWATAVEIPFKFYLEGRPVTNWTVEALAILDATGNYYRSRSERHSREGWNIFRLPRSADPTVPWRLTGRFVPAALPEDAKKFTVRYGPLTTNLAGLPIRLEYTGGGISAKVPAGAEQGVVLLDIVDGDGASMKEWSGKNSEGQPAIAINLKKAAKARWLTLAIFRRIPFEFTVQPVLRSGEGGD